MLYDCLAARFSALMRTASASRTSPDEKPTMEIAFAGWRFVLLSNDSSPMDVYFYHTGVGRYTRAPSVIARRIASMRRAVEFFGEAY